MMSKVVLDAQAEGSAALRVEPTATDNVSTTAPGTELHLGSQDLVRLAGYASANGYVPVSFIVTDANLVPLEVNEQEQVSSDLIRMLRQYGEAEVEAALREEYEGTYVLGVQLVNIESGMQVSIRRRGFVETAIVREAEQLLRAAWSELRLS